MSGSDPGSDRLGRLADEFLERYRRGEKPSVAEYAARHPDLAGQIRELFPALGMMEDVRPGPQTGAGAVGPTPDAESPRRLGEHRIVREVGRGGMGVVYEAEQESLGRRVALKVLPPGALGDAKHVERFQREARAAARLHHTNIVPVFGVGEEGGTHFYVMQYIEGRPLDDVLAELRRLRAEADRRPAPPSEPGATTAVALPGGGPSSSRVARSLWQGQSLPADAEPGEPARPDQTAAAPVSGAPSPSSPLPDPHRPYAKSVAHIGVQAAEALEYAAGQGVLHRDVKPANLLLDVWGTVWLTDFGLAKATGTPNLTRTGDVLGTLRYMAPERLEGRADVRSDVYALGLTLYEMLALRPAFDASGRAELVRQLVAAEPPRLDRLDPALPRDLVTVVHKATAKDPDARYQTPGALADDLRRFLEGRSVLARRASLAEQGWRWCRRRPAAAALVAALLALVLLAAGGGLWLERQRAERRGRAREAVEAALERLPGLRWQGRWTEADAVLAQAASRLDDAGSDGLGKQLEQARADLLLARRLEDIWLGWMTYVTAGRFDPAAATGAYEAAFREAGLAVTEDEEGAASRIRGSALRDLLVASLDDWAFLTSDVRLRERLLRVARLADPDPGWRDRLRDPAVWKDRRALERLAGEAPVAELSPQALTTLARLLDQTGADGEPLLRAAQQRFPGDPLVNNHLSYVLSRKGKPEEAVGFVRSALAVRPESSALYFNLARKLSDAGEDREAVAAFRRAIDLNPGFAQAHNGLGNRFHDLGRFEEAVAAHRRAIELDPGSALAHMELGNDLVATGQPKEAIAAYRRAIDLDPKAAPAHYNLANVYKDQGRLEEAVVAYRRATELDPTYAQAHNNLGNVYHIQGRLEEALAAYRRAAELAPRLPQPHYCLGLIHQGQGRLEEAEAAYRRATELDPRYAAAYTNLGNVLHAQGRSEEAVAAWRRAVEFDPKLAVAHHQLGNALFEKGQLREAAEAYRRVGKLVPQNAGVGASASRQLNRCEHLLALESRLPAILAGGEPPADAGELRDLAWVCQYSQRNYAAAARFYAPAFAAQPKLADDLQAQERYSAACAAALAAAGQGTDAAKLDAAERTRLRGQARAWLSADLAAWAKLVKDNPRERPRAREVLRHWQTDDDLATLRDAGALAGLPPEEQASCRKLWKEVEALLQQAKP
jgi:serine/threonine protein kinase/tetratricopeptide (TPR) repeat protein